MRELTIVELNHVSGCGVSMDVTLWNKLHEGAWSEGVLAATFLSLATAGITWSLLNNPLTAIALGAFVAPYAFMWGYFNSSAWNFVYS